MLQAAYYDQGRNERLGPMSSSSGVDTASSQSVDSHPAQFVPTFLVNLVPLGGVVWLGWDPVTVLTIYAIEVVLSFPLAGMKALFAQQPPRVDEESMVDVSNSFLTEKRGQVELRWLPPIHLRNIPFVVTVFGSSLAAMMVVSFLLSWTIPGPDVLTRRPVVVSVLVLLSGQLYDIGSDYFRGGRYKDVSPYAVVETPVRQLAVLVMLFMNPLVGEGAYPVVVLAVFVVFKLLVEWSAFRATHGEPGRLTSWLSGPDDESDLPGPPTVPPGEPDVRFQTDNSAVTYHAVFHALTKPAVSYAQLFGFLWLFFLLVFGGARAVAVTLLVVSLFLTALLVKSAGCYLRYAPLEYRQYDDTIVAYDTWLDEPQWASSVDVLRHVSLVRDSLADRLCDTRTISLTVGVGERERSLEVGPLTAPEEFVDTFELPILTTDLESMHRGLLTSAAVCFGLYLGLLLLLTVSPWATGDSIVSSIWLLPLVVVPWGLWQASYPSKD